MKRNPKLTDAQRQVLEDLIAELPDATLTQIALRFLDKTGRTISRPSVQKVRKGGGYKSPYLHRDDREALELIIREGAGSKPYRLIAEQFEARTGRPITIGKVWRTAVNEMGLDRIGRGQRNRTRPKTAATRKAQSARARALL